MALHWRLSALVLDRMMMPAISGTTPIAQNARYRGPCDHFTRCAGMAVCCCGFCSWSVVMIPLLEDDEVGQPGGSLRPDPPVVEPAEHGEDEPGEGRARAPAGHHVDQADDGPERPEQPADDPVRGHLDGQRLAGQPAHERAVGPV